MKRSGSVHPDPARVEEAAALEPSPTVTLEDHLPEPTTPGTVGVTFEGLRTARAQRREGPIVTVRLRGDARVLARLDPAVEPELVDDAIASQDLVLVEGSCGEATVVGVLATRRAGTVHVRGDRIEIDAAEEVVLRSGRAALRLRADGDVELVGSRISASSRGLFRLVGRLLRLN